MRLRCTSSLQRKFQHTMVYGMVNLRITKFFSIQSFLNTCVIAKQGGDTGTYCREICDRSQSLSQRSTPLKSCQFNGQGSRVKASSPQSKVSQRRKGSWSKVKAKFQPVKTDRGRRSPNCVTVTPPYEG